MAIGIHACYGVASELRVAAEAVQSDACRWPQNRSQPAERQDWPPQRCAISFEPDACGPDVLPERWPGRCDCNIGQPQGLSHQHRAVQQRHGRSRELSRALQRSNMAHLSPMGNDADHAGPRISDDQQEQRPQVRSDAIQGKTGTSAAGRLTQAAAPEPQRSAGMGWARTRPESGSERQPALH